MTFAVALSILLLLLRRAAASDDEIRSLLEFKKGFKSDPSGRVFSTWSAPSNLSACPGGFHGVVCDAAAASVVGISLDGLGIAGDLKFATLLPLKSLRNLTLSGNLLTGRLVPAIGTMLSLQVIDLSGNQFYGPVPVRLHDLWDLHYLNLSGNNFSGGFPDGIRNLQQLRVLDLRSNGLQGDVQELIPQLRNVEYLDLSRNGFFGSMEFGVENVSSLANTVKYVNLSGNSLGGRLWGDEAMRLFRNLQVLDLGDTGIVGQLPEFGQYLPSLHTLRLGGNQLFGPVPEELVQGGIPLVELDLSVNGFSGPIPIINSTTLVTLNLSSNSMSGSLPPSLANCAVVDLSSNLLSDNISVLSNYNPNLEILDLSSNALTGSLPNLTQFQSLAFLSISNNSLEGSLPLSLGSKLTAVDLSSNIFTGPIPDSFFTSVTITNLNLSGNHLTGPIPIQLSPASVLLVLPTIPPMESLDLSSNALSDGLSSDIGNWGRLKLLNLAGNNLSGQIPSELSKLTVLELLDLSHNSFNGQIPDRLPSSLKFINVSYNYLSGKIPDNLNSFPRSSFMPGNVELENLLSSSSTKNRLSPKSRIEVAVIVVCSLAVLMAVCLLFAHRLTRLRGSSPPEVSGEDIKVGRLSLPSLFNFNHRNNTEQNPTSLSHSNNHLLTPSFSHQMEPVGEIVPAGVGPVYPDQQDNNHPTSGRKSSTDSPIATSPVTLNVYSPDRFSGDLFFLDDSVMFTAEELSRAPAEVLGRSSHGTLYKATFDNSRTLTVKWLRVGLVKKKKDFAKEVKKIGSVRHPNLVHLRAYYWGPMEQERLILADYVSGDSLALHLYESTPRRYSPLSFNQRLTVAIEVARCLLFLHDRGLPHGNLKPTNIILSSPDYTVRLTDYGLHRLMTKAGVSEQILNLGALGYRAPELANVHKPIPSFKADVYAFGVIMMELLTRRSAGDIISGQSGAVDLTDWVRMCDREARGMDCVDRDMVEREEESRGGIEDMLGVSLRCILPVNERPNIRQVLDGLSSV